MQRLSALSVAAGFAIVLLCFAAAPIFEVVPLETVSETSSNASIGDLNGDGSPDIVLVKGRHWQLTTKIFLGDGKGHFVPGPPLTEQRYQKLFRLARRHDKERPS
jgi:hypothetical protein